MLNNFIYAQSKAMFEERLHEVPSEAIVFIEDTKEIWNHGHYFAGDCGFDQDLFSEVQTAVAALQAEKVNRNELSDYAKKADLPSLDGYLTKDAANKIYATIAQINMVSESLTDLTTSVNDYIGNTSVTKNEETLTVTINNTSQSLTNT